MYKKKLYKYTIGDTTTVTYYKPEKIQAYEPMLRLIAQSEDFYLTDYTNFVSCIDIPLEDEQLWFEVDKKDINIKISQLDNIKTKQAKQNNSIDISMLVLDTILQQNSASTFGLEQEVSMMSLEEEEPQKAPKVLSNFYFIMIQRGLKTVEEVPFQYQEEVQKLITESQV